MRIHDWSSRLFIVLPIFLGTWLAVTPVNARDAEHAKTLFEDGMRDMPEGNYEKACPAFAESLRLDPLPGTAFTLAVCESRWGRVATAQNRYRDFLRMIDLLPLKEKKKQVDRVNVATEQIAKLDEVIPTVTLKLPPGAPSDIVVKRNDQVLGAADFGVAVALDPGEYTFSTEVPGLPLKKKRIILGKAEKKTIVLEVPNAESELSGDSTGKTAPTSGRKIGGFVVGGVGLVGLVVGAVTTGLAFGEKDVADAHCGTKIGETNPKLCDQTGLDAVQSIGRLNIVSTSAFITGGIGLGVGILLIATAPKTNLLPQDARGRSMHVGVLSASSSHFVVGLHGNW